MSQDAAVKPEGVTGFHFYISFHCVNVLSPNDLSPDMLHINVYPDRAGEISLSQLTSREAPV